MSYLEHIFTDSIYHSMDVKNSELEEKLREEIKETMKKEKMDHKSNVGGYQKDIKKNKQLFYDNVKHHFERYLQLLEVENRKLILTNIWFNVNFEHSYNVSHVHPECHFSGSYYLKVPEDSGVLKFWRDNSFIQMHPELYELICPVFRTHFSIEPKKHLLLVFPSYLQHEVLQNRNKEDRISISFNLNLERND
tara:strand:- start:3 stop:581 length:579 start_codon:yes stop_codon:yes gene_type:complete